METPDPAACADADAIRTTAGRSERAVDLAPYEMLVLICIAYFQPITRGRVGSQRKSTVEAKDVVESFPHYAAPKILR